MRTVEYVQGTTHYANRRIRGATHGRRCRKKHGPTCGGAFKCPVCLRIVGFCQGADGSPECDRCWLRRVSAARLAKAQEKQ